MKTATYKLIGLFTLVLSASIALAQDPATDMQNYEPVVKSEVSEEASRPIAPGAITDVSFKVYPNPANTLLNVELVSDPNTQTELRIFNPVWQQVYYRNVTGDTFLTVDITGFAEGMYYVRLTSGDNQILVKKVQILP